MVTAELSQFVNALEGAAPAGTAVVYLIQTAPVKASVVADLQRLGLGDSPIVEGIMLAFDPFRFIGGDTDIVEDFMGFSQP